MPPSEPLILFDGVCHLCTGSVVFIMKRDPAARFRFAPLESEVGRASIERCRLREDALRTLVLIEGGRCRTRSSAALGIVRRLSGPWPLLYGLIIVPRPLRDLCYDFVARNRYRWFGRHAECYVPAPEDRDRFLA